jgi:type II secretory pathway predicted ATPase ExeA
MTSWSVSTLRQRRLNYAWDSKSLLSLILVGLPELDERLKCRRNHSLYSRLHHRIAIGPLSAEDTADYIRTRLARVGGSRDLFTADAITLLHEAAACKITSPRYSTAPNITPTLARLITMLASPSNWLGHCRPLSPASAPMNSKSWTPA